MPEINRRQPLCGAPSLQPLVHQLATPTCANNHGNKLLCGCRMKQISQATSCVMPFAKRLAQFDLVHASHLWPSTGQGGGHHQCKRQAACCLVARCSQQAKQPVVCRLHRANASSAASWKACCKWKNHWGWCTQIVRRLHPVNAHHQHKQQVACCLFRNYYSPVAKTRAQHYCQKAACR